MKEDLTKAKKQLKIARGSSAIGVAAMLLKYALGLSVSSLDSMLLGICSLIFVLSIAILVVVSKKEKTL